MPLVTSTEMFKKAYDGGYAIGAFNVNNMEIVQGITEACQEEHAPVILQVSKGARAYANHNYLVKLVEAAVICCPDIPIVLHLDHGPDFETCKACIDGGFTSVMIDASSKPFAENIEITKKVVEYAHDHGVVVEAELGTLAGIEDEVKVAAHEASYTRPEEVEEFVSKTGCDSLAIAIGTSHGAYKFKPEQCTRNEQGILVPPPLRFDVLKEVSKRLPGFPIVLHGSSSVPQDYVKMINDNTVVMCVLDDFLGDLDVFGKGLGGSVDHDGSEAAVDAGLAGFEVGAVVQMQNDGDIGAANYGSLDQFDQIVVVRVGAGTLGNLEDNGSVLFLAGLSDALNDFHVVDVESTDGVAAVISFLEHFGRSNQRHNDISLVYSYSTKNSSKFQLFLQ